MTNVPMPVEFRPSERWHCMKSCARWRLAMITSDKQLQTNTINVNTELTRASEVFPTVAYDSRRQNDTDLLQDVSRESRPSF
jgi:hypothetical protein